MDCSLWRLLESCSTQGRNEYGRSTSLEPLSSGNEKAHLRVRLSFSVKQPYVDICAPDKEGGRDEKYGEVCLSPLGKFVLRPYSLRPCVEQDSKSRHNEQSIGKKNHPEESRPCERKAKKTEMYALSAPNSPYFKLAGQRILSSFSGLVSFLMRFNANKLSFLNAIR